MEGWGLSDALPGLYLAFLALLGDRALRRWYDPVPAWVWSVFAALLLALFGAALFGGAVLLPLDNLRGSVPFQHLAPTDPHGNVLQGDLVQLVAPALDVARAEVLAGRWPLWNPWAGAGVPLLADPQAQPFQPLVMLALAFDTGRLAAVVAGSRLLVALVFGFLLLRRQGLGYQAALTGAVAYGLGGFLMLWLGWPLATSAALLPALLYALARAVDEPAGRNLVLLFGVTFCLLLAGHPETIAYALLLGTAFGLHRGLGLAPEDRRAALVRPAGALALAALAAAPVLLPTALHLPETTRWEALASPAGSQTPIEARPDAPPGTASGPVDGKPGPGRRLRQALVPIAFPNAFGNSRYAHYWGRDNTNEDAGAHVGTAALLAALLAAGSGAFPGRRGRSPFAQERLLLAAAGVCLGVFAASALAPDFVHAWLPGLHGGQRLAMVLGLCLAYLAACTLERCLRGEGPHPAVLLGAVAALGAVLGWAYLAHRHPEEPATLEVLRFGWLHWHGRFLVAGAAVLGLVLWKPRLRRIAVIFPFLVAAELVLAHGNVNPPMPERLLFPRVPALAFLGDHPGGRMIALGGTLPPNLATLYRLADARVYNPTEPLAYRQLTEPLLHKPPANVPAWGVADHPILDRLGVRWVLAGPDAALPAPLVLRFEDASARIYERPGALPLVFAESEAGEDLPEEISHVFDQGGTRFSGLSTLNRSHHLVASVYAQPGAWHLLVAGAHRSAGSSHGVFPAFEAAPGESFVLLYRPPGLVAGGLLAALGLALAAAWWIPRPRKGLE